MGSYFDISLSLLAHFDSSVILTKAPNGASVTAAVSLFAVLVTDIFPQMHAQRGRSWKFLKISVHFRHQPFSRTVTSELHL